MSIVLTSNLPAPHAPSVLEWLRRAGSAPRIAWVAPSTASGRERFPAARAAFGRLGFSRVEYCDIDAEPDDAQLARLDQYDIVYLSGGDPIVFRRSLVHSGMSTLLEKYSEAGGQLVAASGGAMQLTSNISLFRLQTLPLDVVIAEHAAHAALGLVSYELLPHADRLGPEFLEKVRLYSGRVPGDIVALSDGAAVLNTADETRYAGDVLRLRKGNNVALA